MNPLFAATWPFRQLSRLSRSFVGELTWHPPAWAIVARKTARRRPLLFFVPPSLFLALVVAGLWTWHWYSHLPKPVTVDWNLSLAPVGQPADRFLPQPLTLTFDSSVATLESIGKPVSSGITLTPPLAGKWTWSDGATLIFEPAGYWSAGTHYRVTLARQLFSSHARLSTLSKEFLSDPLSVAIRDSLFYIDPKNASDKQITATLVFNQPVDRASLERAITLEVENGPNVFTGPASATGRCQVTYDKLDRIAYLRSVNITVPAQSAHAVLTVPSQVRASSGGTSLGTIATADILVPSTPDLFHVNSASIVIATTANGDPEQTLILITSVGVKPAALASALHAWILPPPQTMIDAETGDKVKRWASPAQVNADTLAKSTPVSLTLIPGTEEFATVNSFKMKVPEKSAIYLHVDSGLASLGGFVLADYFASVQTVPDYPRAVRIMHDGSLLALSGERKLSISSRGVEQLEYRLARVTPSSINHLVSQSEGSFQSPVFVYNTFDESNITEQVIRRQDIAVTDDATNNYSALDFSEFVDGSDANQGKLGLFLLHILARQGGSNGGYYRPDGSVMPNPRPGTRPMAADGLGYSDPQDPVDMSNLLNDSRLILVTDLGILVKDNADGTHDVFVQSIKTGQPVGGAQVDVLGKNGIPVVTAPTDDTGHASIPSLFDFVRQQHPVAYVVRLGKDVSFLPFGRADRVLDFSRFDVGGVSGQTLHDLTAFVFTDRGIYRPGDEAKLGLIVKQRDWQGNLDGLPLRLDVVDPRGQTVQSRVLKLNAAGFLEASFPTRETSLTGQYQVNCYLIRGKNDETLLGSQSLRVAEFLPDRMKIKATLSTSVPEGWVSGANLKGLVALENLYGAPAAGHRVSGKVTLDPSQFSFGRYPDYTFTDPYLKPDAERTSHEQDLPDQTSDDTGHASFDLAISTKEQSAYQLSFLAEGFEKEGGRSVTAETSVLVSPRAWLVGYKPDGDFSYVHLNTLRTVRFLAVDPTLKPTTVDHLKLKLVERRFVSVLEQQPNGNYAYDSVLKEIPFNEQELAISDAGLDWPLNTTQPGDFAARLYDDHGDLVADVRYTVAGAANVVRALDRNAELHATLSKTEYNAGDDIEVEINAPYTGAGLLTIERDKVYAHAWFTANSTTSVQHIQIPKDFEGNGYLNIAYVRALDSHEIYMSPLSYAVLPFQVNREARHTHIIIDVPNVAVPGQPLEMKITASRPTQAVVYAVDEGILQVAGYGLPDPLGYFFQKRALEVGTRQTVDQILPEYTLAKELSAAGGDAGEDDLAHHLNPFKRKHDAPVAYWSGIVDLGPDAKTFTYHVPDYFSGTIRVMVVANTADAVGSDQARTQVRGPFVISSNVPTFVAPGDTFDVSVTVANNITGSGPNAAVALNLETTPGLEVTQKPDPSVTIPEGRDASFHWQLRAMDLLGNADLTVTAQCSGQRSSLASHLSIRPPAPYLTTLTSGYFKDSEKRVALTRQLYPQYRKATALASPLPQGLTRGLGEYLEHYAYGCTEQLVSKAFPTMVGNDVMQQGLSRSDVASHLAEILDVAATRQNNDGAFGLWMAQPDLHFDLPSAHIMHFMTEAKERGFDVPSDLLSRGLGHLQRDANGTPSDFREARNQAYEIYLLARSGRVMTNALEHNRHWFEQNAPDKWSDDIAAVYEAATYALLQNQDEGDKLINRFQLQNGTHRWPEEEIDYDDDLGRAAQFIYLVTLHFPERLKSLSPDDLMTLAYPIIDDEFNTVSSAEAILALDTYGHAMQTSFLSGVVEIDAVSGAQTRKLDLTGAALYPEATFDRGTDALLFKKALTSGNLTNGLVYQVTESGFEQTTITTPISDGIEVSREYRNQADHPVTTAKLGEELTVVVRARSTDNQVLANVAIEDLLPGGFEIVEESARTGACSGWGAIEYTDVREDRLLAFGTISGTETEIRYRIKATNCGTYAIAPIQAEAMYHQKIRARGISGTITVAD